MIKYIHIFYLFVIGINTIGAQNTVEFTQEEKDWIKAHPVIQFGYEPDWPPYEMYVNGEYTGIIGEYVKLIEQYTGIDMQPIPDITWNESIAQLKSGAIHIVPVAGITDERKEFLAFTKPYISDPLVIVTRDDYKFVSGLIDLEGETMSLPEGYYTIDLIKKDFPEIDIQLAKTIKDCLLDVSTSRTDAFVGSLSVVSYYINSLGYANLKIASPTHYEYTQMGLAVTKDWIVFRDIVQKIFDNIPKEKHASIKNKWISVRYEHGIDTKEVRLYIFYALGFFAIILFVFYIWNKTLRIQIRTRKAAEKNLKASLELINQKNSEKDILLKEIHHRVKNNLQIVYSLLNMQARQVENKDTLKVITEGKTRIKSMSLIHQILYESDNLNEVDLHDYIYSLKDSIKDIYKDKEKSIKVKVKTKDITLSLEKAIPLGLILNELLTNSYKYAFEGKETGEIRIVLKKEADHFYFKYRDNGVGISNEDLSSYTSLGMRLISRLSEQLLAENTVLKNNNGIFFSFYFK